MKHETKFRDPVKVIRDALAEAVVFYYPFDGLLREGKHFTRRPFPCMEELFYDVPGSDGILNSPLLLIQEPPHGTCTHYENDEVPDTKDNQVSFSVDVDHRSFSFGPVELLALRKLIPKHLSKCSTFDVLTFGFGAPLPYN
ncbi:hypothetical protein LguiB_027018 [Lonicera macranthoides]